jgi:hypothetical protein
LGIPLADVFVLFKPFTTSLFLLAGAPGFIITAVLFNPYPLSHKDLFMRKILALSGTLAATLLLSACNAIPTPLNTPSETAQKFVCGGEKLALDGDYAFYNGRRYSYQNMSGGQALYRYHSSQLAVKKVGNERTLIVELTAKPCVAAN